MKTVQFVFALHNHQPVGNFDHVFTEAYNGAYLPFLELLESYPSFRVSLHHTGPLLEWLAKKQPGYLERLGTLVQAGQVELLGGGFYEPILPVIPEADRVGQIDRMSDWLEERFGLRPRGMWLAERVWEPNLPRAMNLAGMEYTVLDDSHFKSVGIGEEEALGYYLTEDLGHTTAVFPIKENVRQRIPYGTPEEIVDYLRSVASAEVARTVVMADDGEKFGVWPGSHRYCYLEGWLYRFVEMIVNNDDWIQLRSFGEVLDSTAPMGRVYLPTASYVEMMEWAMPPAAINRYQRFVSGLKDGGEYDGNKTFVRGGFWRSFFTKYAEANQLHKKMLRVARKLEALPAGVREGSEALRAREHLWQGQCNCGYWHGVFGGIYLTNLRNALYGHLIEAEKTADALSRKGDKWVEFFAEDFDTDGETELIVETPAQIAVLQPAAGGTVVEHDVRRWNLNLVDTMMRRREYYHEALMQRNGNRPRVESEEELAEILAEDWYRRGSLVDHFLGDDATPEALRSTIYAELGTFVNEPYETSWRKERGQGVIRMQREGTVNLPIGTVPVRVEKAVRFDASAPTARIEYTIVNLSDVEIRTRFGAEFVVNLLAGNAPDRYHQIPGVALGAHATLDSTGAVPDVSRFALVDEWLGLRVAYTLSRQAEHWRFPIETVSNSESGIERLFQGTVLLPVWRIVVAPGQRFRVQIDQEVTEV